MGKCTTLHVTSRTRERNERTAAGVGTSVHTTSDVAGADISHANVATRVVNAALDGESAVCTDILGVVGCWA